MKCNVGGEDKSLRLLLGVETLLLSLGAPLSTSGKVVFLALSCFAFLSVASAFCPINKMRGVSTYQPKADCDE